MKALLTLAAVAAATLLAPAVSQADMLSGGIP